MDLLLGILEAPTIIDGLQNPYSATKARDLILAHQSREPENLQTGLLLGGMALSREDVPTCKSIKKNKANINSWALGH